MKLNKTLIGVLAIICIVLSVCAVSANATADYTGNNHGDYYLDGSHDGHDGQIIPPDINHNEAAMHNNANTTNMTNSSNANVNNGHNLSNTTNATTNTTTNATNATNATATHKLPATGNPILMLLIVTGAAVGIYSIRRRN